MALCISHTLWYCSIDQELISVRPRGLEFTEMNPALFVYSSTDCTVTGVWTRGTQSVFSMQIRPLSVSKLLVAFMLFLLRAKQVPFCYWTICVWYSCCLTVSHSWNHGIPPWFGLLNILLACFKIVLMFNYTSNMAQSLWCCSFHILTILLILL